MAKFSAGPEIERLIKLMSRLPGLGPRSARKAALSLIKRREDLLAPLALALAEARDRISVCGQCGNVDTMSPCGVCQDADRDRSLIIVVEDVGDLWALERAGVSKCLYHVLGGHLSPLDGIGPDELNIASLVERVGRGEVREVVLALNATVEGQSTMHYLRDLLAETDIFVSEIQKGVPIGGELDYLDDGTLAAAIKDRRRI